MLPVGPDLGSGPGWGGSVHVAQLCCCAPIKSESLMVVTSVKKCVSAPLIQGISDIHKTCPERFFFVFHFLN